MVLVKDNGDLGAIDATPRRCYREATVCGVSSDLRNLKLRDLGGSRNPRKNVSPPPPPPTTSESDLTAVDQTKDGSEAKKKRERERDGDEVLSRLIEWFVEAERLDLVVPVPDPDPGMSFWRKEIKKQKKPPTEVSGWNFLSCFNHDAPPRRAPVADVPKCKMCWGDHCESCCSYLMEFPPDGVLRNRDDYLLVCACSREIAADGRCPNPRCHPNRLQRVVSKESITSPSYSP